MGFEQLVLPEDKVLEEKRNQIDDWNKTYCYHHDDSSDRDVPAEEFPIDLDYVNDPIEVTRLMNEHHVDIICSAQSRLVSFMASDDLMEALRRCLIVMCGGEKFPEGLMHRLQEQTPNAHIFNCYGPTETTVESNCHELTHEECVTVGRPLLNVQECIVDQDLNELPVGVIGELLIGGVQVAVALQPMSFSHTRGPPLFRIFSPCARKAFSVAPVGLHPACYKTEPCFRRRSDVPRPIFLQRSGLPHTVLHHPGSRKTAGTHLY